MESRARFLGHPAHQMLIVFPLGLLGASVVFDLLFRVLDRPVMAEVAYWTMAGGLLTALAAAPLGLVDWLAIPKGTRARAVGALHGAGNVLVVALFLASWMTRHAAPAYPPVVAAVFAWLGLALAGVTAWLGGELVSRLGIGVHDHASVNAPSSLRDRTASAIPSPRRP